MFLHLLPMRFIPISVRYILSVYVAGLLFFTLFRAVLVIANIHQLHGVPGVWGVMAQSMFMGLRFDTVVSGYLLALPSVILLLAEYTGLFKKQAFNAMFLFSCIVYPIAFFLCATDIPFYINYSNRLNVSILNWTNSPLFMVKMVWQDNVFLAYFFLFVVVSVAFVFLMKRIGRRFRPMITMAYPRLPVGQLASKILAGLVFLGLMLLGIRGRTDEKSPIVVGTAFFCNYNLPNQAGLNPIFTFMSSWTDGLKDENKSLALIDDKEAMKVAARYLNIADPEKGISKQVSATTAPHKYNVVLVLMESMSANYLHRFGDSLGLTPNIDSLALHGYSFDNFYSAGIHTFNGIFSTLYGYPALMARHTMEGAVIPHYTGLPYFFRQRGYETLYFTTHDDQFDNVGGFLSANHIQRIISKKDYPAAMVHSTLGASDHEMFDFSLPILKELHDRHQPFLSVLMTTSNHNPYVIPEGILFAPKHTDVRGGCVEYADWSIGYFMKKAAAMPWYDSTIFVFLGDHGADVGAPPYANMPYSYSHIPCIIYSPMFRSEPKVLRSPGGQIDVFPTIAGLLGGSYTTTGMGVDLLHTTRPWMAFSQDDKIGVADTTNLYIWQKSGPEYMFGIAGRQDVLPANRALADTMRTYAFSMIQYAQWLRNNNKTGGDAVK